MTEADWLTATDPAPMLEFLRGKVSERKLRLFACACCRQVWDFLSEGDSRDAVLVAERYADRLASLDELNAISERVEAACDLYGGEPVYAPSYWACAAGIDAAAATCAIYAECHAAFIVNYEAEDYDERREKIFIRERALQASLLRDIFGNPFRPVTVEPSWLTATVVSLATAIYDERAFDRLPVLADALEDAGCTSREMLDHCRQPGEYMRGCWCVDLVLNRQ